MEKAKKCVFCEIVAGRAKAYKVYEDELSMCILDIAPFTEGHCLVIPKRHAQFWHDLTEKEIECLFKTARMVAKKMLKQYNSDFICMYARGRRIPHTHIFPVPTASRWPSQIPKARVLDQPAMNIDLFSTSLAAAGIQLPKDRVIDGKDMLPLLSGKDKSSPHEFIYFYKGKQLQAMRSGNWKYQLKHYVYYSPMGKKQGPWLFDLAKDPNESYNVIGLYPELARKFEKQTAAWQKNFDRGLK